MLDFYTFNYFSKQKDIQHLITKKSLTKPHTFSLALHTGENQKNIIQNRQYLRNYFKNTKPLHFIVANQTHSNHIKIITQKESKGWESEANAIENCDALLTNVPNIILSILTADCVPLLIYDKKKQVIGAVHAGWKGTQKQIIKHTIEKMQDTYQSNPQDIYIGIAPSIGACCYEVGEDVAKHFLDTPKGYTQKGEKYMLNLPYLNQQQLLSTGIPLENIEMSNVCTSCEVEHYFSYRKEQGCTGRFMSMIGLKDKHAN